MQEIQVEVDSVTEHRRLQNRLSQRKFRQKKAEEQKLAQTTFELATNDVETTLRGYDGNVESLHEDYAGYGLSPSISMNEETSWQSLLQNLPHQAHSISSPPNMMVGGDMGMDMNMELSREQPRRLTDTGTDISNDVSSSTLHYYLLPVKPNILTMNLASLEAETVGDNPYYSAWTPNTGVGSSTPNSSISSSAASNYHFPYRPEGPSPTPKSSTTSTFPSLPPLLHVSAQTGNRGVVQSLLKHGAAVNETDGHGQSALHVAAEYGHEAIVSLLLAHGADIEALDKDGKSALYLAVSASHNEVVDVLLRHRQEH
ncbi:ankyrin repeat-containing protein [Rutstroemia sp. NJR-2017a WRK4]|nr:ankyrin repeat-containing protein [Rutstroemia sp. NJR-2017a WRK4]